MHVSSPPLYLSQNNFFIEKNPTIVTFPVKNLELRCEGGKREIGEKSRMAGQGEGVGGSKGRGRRAGKGVCHAGQSAFGLPLVWGAVSEVSLRGPAGCDSWLRACAATELCVAFPPPTPRQLAQGHHSRSQGTGRAARRVEIRPCRQHLPRRHAL